MPSKKEIDLLGEIAALESRVEELIIQNESLRKCLTVPKLKIPTSEAKRKGLPYLSSFIAAATFPLAAGFFRAIYRKIYNLKK